MNEPPVRIRPVNPTAASTPPTAGSRGRHRLLMGLSAGVVLAALGYVGVSMVVADRLTKPYRRPLASSPAALGLPYEDVTFSSTVDGTTLRGWFLPVEASDRTVVVVHGRSSSRTGDLGELVAQAAALVAGGYNVLLFDFRAHGLSDGTRYTLGADEQGDVLGAVAWLESRGFAPDRVGFWAHSMGAATVLLAAAASPDVRNIVADSSFARLEDLLARELPRESGLPDFFNPAILYFGRELFGLDTRVLNPMEAVAGLPPRSLFIIHAEADGLIPVDHARRIAAAAGPAVWDVWIFPGSRHDRVWSAAPELYRSRALAFFDERLH